MNTLDTIAERADLTKQAVRMRVKNLGMESHFEIVNGKAVRIFTDEEADKVINYKAKKPGRKRRI